MNENEEAAVRARVEAATEGPWLAGDNDGDPVVLVRRGDLEHFIDWKFAPGGQAQGFADAEFIAHARTDLPAALDEVTRLRAALDEARIRANDWMGAAAAREGALRAAEQERDEARAEVERLDQPLRSDHPAVINAEKRGHERGWDAAREEFKPRAEAAESALAAVREWAKRHVGQWHPASQTPLTFDGGVGAAAHDVLAALATPTTADEGGAHA